MNIAKKKAEPINEVDEIVDKTVSLIESFDRCPTVANFLRENKDEENAECIYHKLALTEAMIDPKKSFMFENGMQIPAIGTKMKSKATLNGIFESAKDESEFVQLVECNICPHLDTELTEFDKEELKEHYLTHKNK